jgi:hypothetical protein
MSVDPKEILRSNPQHDGSDLPELASVLVRRNRGAGVIVNANHGPRRRLVPGFML